MDAIAGQAQPPNHATGPLSAQPRLRMRPQALPATADLARF